MTRQPELCWTGKRDRAEVPPHVLREVPALSHGTPGPALGNEVIRGDNLPALHALLPALAGRVRLVYIDPPYNTGNTFAHYEDGLEHGRWLSLMRDRLGLLRSLLAEDGSLWISVDDNEAHYLKVLCDEIFERRNFIANVIWQKKFAPQNDSTWLSDSHDHILVFARDKAVWRPSPLPRTPAMDARYKNPDEDPRGPWMSDNLSVKTYSAACDYPITTPSGRVVHPPAGACWRFNRQKLDELIRDDRIFWGRNGNNVPRLKRFLSEVQDRAVAKTIWLREEVGDNQDAKREVKLFNPDEVFGTPKPERLLQRILTLATRPGDLVLDAFAGSGTTGAVAHKMGRRWILVEQGAHCETHILPRMRRVVDGDDPGGISEAVGWKGGGGFRCFRLAPAPPLPDGNLFSLEV